MKTTTKFKKILGMLILCLGMSALSFAQCNAGFTYTVGTAGQVGFTNTSVGTNTNTVYYWTYGDNQHYSNTTGVAPSHTYAYNGTYNVYLNISDSINFSGTCSSTYSASIVITNTATCNLAVGFTYIVNSAGLVNFTNTSTGVNGNMTISWNFGDGGSSSQLSPSHTFAYNGHYSVNLLIQDNQGYCTGSVTDTLNISNTANPPSCTAAFTYTLGTNGSVAFTNTSTGNIVNPNYQWNFGDGSGTSTQSSPSHVYTYNGTYNVTFNEADTLSSYGCNHTQAITITNATNNPNCHDSAYFTMYKDTSQVGVWNVYLNTWNNLSYPTNAVWTWGDGTSSTGLYPSHTYASAGWYTICVKAFFSCGDSSNYCRSDSVYRNSSMITVHVINTQSGINQTKNAVSSVKAYPNPFADNITINLNAVTGSSITYTISDMYGKQLLNEKVVIERGENKIGINTTEFSNGVYFVNIIDNNSKKIQTLKIVK